MARSGRSSMRNLPLVVSTTAVYFLSGLMVTEGRSEYFFGVGAMAGDEAGVSPAAGVLSALSPPQANARTARNADAPKSGQSRSMKLSSLTRRGYVAIMAQAGASVSRRHGLKGGAGGSSAGGGPGSRRG